MHDTEGLDVCRALVSGSVEGKIRILKPENWEKIDHMRAEIR